MKKVFLTTVFGTLLVVVVFVVFASFQPESKAKDVAIKDVAVVDSKEVQQIRELHIKGDIDATIDQAKAYLKSQPNNIEVLIRLAESYAFKGDLTLAEDYIKKALTASDNKSVWSLRALATIYRTRYEISEDAKLKQKYLDLAMIEIAKALVLSPNDAWANAEAAQIYIKDNKAKAVEAIGFALAVEPENKYFLGVKQKIQDMK